LRHHRRWTRRWRRRHPRPLTAQPLPQRLWRRPPPRHRRPLPAHPPRQQPAATRSVPVTMPVPLLVCLATRSLRPRQMAARRRHRAPLFLLLLLVRLLLLLLLRLRLNPPTLAATALLQQPRRSCHALPPAAATPSRSMPVRVMVVLPAPACQATRLTCRRQRQHLHPRTQSRLQPMARLPRLW